MEKLFSNVSSLDVKLDTLNDRLIIRRIDVTQTSLIIDGKELIKPSYQNLNGYDSLAKELLKLKLGMLTKVESDSSIEYYKVVRCDSVLCLRFAAIGLPFNNEARIDSIYLNIKSLLKAGILWNNLKFHPLDNPNDFNQTIKGNSGWTRSSQLLEEFTEAFFTHKVGDIFLVKNTELNFAWIVYKTENEQFFERKQILFATNR
jgi:hypothetical protein